MSSTWADRCPREAGPGAGTSQRCDTTSRPPPTAIPCTCEDCMHRFTVPTTPSVQADFGREVDAQTRDRPSAQCQKTCDLQGKPSVGLEPTTPSLP